MRTLTLLLAALLGVLSRGVAADGADEAFSQDQLKRERDLIGLRGPVGPRGNHGPLGRKGARGDVGPGALRPVQGKVGPQGHRGPQGFTGAKGAKGSKGVMGVVGPTGPVGEMGTKSTVVGPKGFMGEPGPAGPSGEPGPRGVFGPWAGAGPKGARGPKGDAPMGPKGDQGVKGSRGVVGPVGKRGKRGPPGIAGFAGEQGVRGPVGPDGASEKGPQGDVGAPGPKGNIGLRGPRGPQGKKGLRGYEGVYGPKGIKGPPGYRGKRGPRGVAGTKGNPGRPGVQGDIGPQGKKGEQGARGPASMLVAPKGRQGFPGEDGDDGHRGERGAKGPDGPKGRPNFEVGPRGPEGKRGEANHRPQTKFYRLMSGDWLRKNALFFSKPEKLSDDDDADERERKMLKIQGSDAGSMLFAVPLAGPGELSPGRHYVAELHVAAVDLSADIDLFVGIADGSRVAGFLRSEAGNAALGKVMHGLENRTRDRLDQIEDAEARASSELLQTSVSGEGALRQMRIARPDTLLEVDTPHLAPPADERPPPSAAQQLSEQEALLAKENAETIARQHTVAREVADAAKDKEEIAAGKEPSIDPKFNPKWFTILIRIDTAEATEVLARTTGNQMPVMSAVPFKLNAEEGLSIVAYADDPAERYGIYAIEATLHEESP